MLAALGIATRCATDPAVDPELISWGFTEGNACCASEAIVNTAVPNGFHPIPESDDSDSDSSEDDSYDDMPSQTVSEEDSSEMSVNEKTITLDDMSTILTSSSLEFDFVNYEATSEFSEEL